MGKETMAKYMTLFDFLDDRNNELGESPDGAWMARMQESITDFNAGNGTNFHPYSAFIMWVEHKGEDVPDET